MTRLLVQQIRTYVCIILTRRITDEKNNCNSTGILLVLGASLLFAGGGSQKKNNSGVVVLNYTHYSVGTHLSKPWWDVVYKCFNEKYKGQIELKIEELPCDTLYADKMKVLAAARQLPDVVRKKWHQGSGYSERSGHRTDAFPELGS
jgi:ABC-type glycerol-3-phosphate transport system substrate-binding protein